MLINLLVGMVLGSLMETTSIEKNQQKALHKN